MHRCAAAGVILPERATYSAPPGSRPGLNEEPVYIALGGDGKAHHVRNVAPGTSVDLGALVMPSLVAPLEELPGAGAGGEGSAPGSHHGAELELTPEQEALVDDLVTMTGAHPVDIFGSPLGLRGADAARRSIDGGAWRGLEPVRHSLDGGSARRSIDARQSLVLPIIAEDRQSSHDGSMELPSMRISNPSASASLQLGGHGLASHAMGSLYLGAAGRPLQARPLHSLHLRSLHLRSQHMPSLQLRSQHMPSLQLRSQHMPSLQLRSQHMPSMQLQQRPPASAGAEERVAWMSQQLTTIASMFSPLSSVMLSGYLGPGGGGGSLVLGGQASCMVVPVVPASIYEHTLAARPNFDNRSMPRRNWMFIAVNGIMLVALVVGSVLDVEIKE